MAASTARTEARRAIDDRCRSSSRPTTTSSVTKLILSSNGDGTLSVIRENDAQTFVPAGTIKTAPGAKTMAIDPKSGRLFLVGADVAKIDPPSKQGGRPRVTYVPNSLKLLYFDPIN